MDEKFYTVYHREQTKFLKKEELDLVFECSEDLKRYEVSEFDYGVHNRYVFCINNETEVVGVLIYYFNAEGGIWLSKIYVKSTCRRKGIAVKLFQELLRLNKTIDLGINPTNQESMQFFSFLGFKSIYVAYRKSV